MPLFVKIAFKKMFSFLYESENHLNRSFNTSFIFYPLGVYMLIDWKLRVRLEPPQLPDMWATLTIYSHSIQGSFDFPQNRLYHLPHLSKNVTSGIAQTYRGLSLNNSLNILGSLYNFYICRIIFPTKYAEQVYISERSLIKGLA